MSRAVAQCALVMGAGSSPHRGRTFLKSFASVCGAHPATCEKWGATTLVKKSSLKVGGLDVLTTRHPLDNDYLHVL